MHRFHTILREGKPVTETSCCEIRSDSPRRCRQTGLCIWHFPWRWGSQPSHQLGIWRSAVSSPSSSGAEPRLLKGFLDFRGTRRPASPGVVWGQVWGFMASLPLLNLGPPSSTCLVSLSPRESAPKRHLDPLSRSCMVVTSIQTDHTTPFVLCSSSPHLVYACAAG